MYVIARYSHSAHVIHNQLFLVGGVNVNHSVPGVACVDMNSKKVTEFQIPVSILKNFGNKKFSIAFDNINFSFDF